MKKRVALLLTATVLASALAGCGSSAKEETTAAKQTTAAAAAATTAAAAAAPTEAAKEEIPNFNAEGFPIVDEKITLKVMMLIRDTDSVTEPEEMPALQRLEEQTGIKAEYEFVKASEWKTKLNLTLATGEYPDVIYDNGTGVDVEDHCVEQGIFIPLDDLITEYMPTYVEREAMSAIDLNRLLVASDGQTYSLGYKTGADYTMGCHFFINEAWIEKLGLEVPSTVAELTDVLRAFKTQDPNGNGQADEIPFSASMSYMYFKNHAWLFGLPIQSSKTLNSYFYIDESKQVQPYPAQEGFREFLEWMHLCYEEGLLDKETISQDENTLKAKIGEGNVGFFLDYRLGGSYPGSVIHDTHALWIPSKDEALMYNGIPGTTNRIFVSCTNEYVPQTMRWLDAQLETEMMANIYKGEKDAEKGGWFYNAEGKIESNPEQSDVMNYLGVNGFLFAPSEYFLETYHNSVAVVDKVAACKAYEDAGLVQTYSNLHLSEIKFTAEEKDKQTKIQTELDTAVREYMASAIVEGVTDDSWNNFQKIITDMGIFELQELYQTGIEALGI